jgi:hypothetical protein
MVDWPLSVLRVGAAGGRRRMEVLSRVVCVRMPIPPAQPCAAFVRFLIVETNSEASETRRYNGTPRGFVLGCPARTRTSPASNTRCSEVWYDRFARTRVSPYSSVIASSKWPISSNTTRCVPLMRSNCRYSSSNASPVPSPRSGNRLACSGSHPLTRLRTPVPNTEGVPKNSSRAATTRRRC